MQTRSALPLRYLPGIASCGTAEPSGQNVPCWQTNPSALPPGQKRPSGHGPVQVAICSPLAVPRRPAAQGLQRTAIARPGTIPRRSRSCSRRCTAHRGCSQAHGSVGAESTVPNLRGSERCTWPRRPLNWPQAQSTQAAGNLPRLEFLALGKPCTSPAPEFCQRPGGQLVQAKAQPTKRPRVANLPRYTLAARLRLQVLVPPEGQFCTRQPMSARPTRRTSSWHGEPLHVARPSSSWCLPTG